MCMFDRAYRYLDNNKLDELVLENGTFDNLSTLVYV